MENGEWSMENGVWRMMFWFQHWIVRLQLLCHLSLRIVLFMYFGLDVLRLSRFLHWFHSVCWIDPLVE